MIKTIRQVGNGNAIPLDKSVMDLLHLQTGSQVQITVSGGQLIVSPVNVGLPADEVRRSVAKFQKKYDRALRELAK